MGETVELNLIIRWSWIKQQRLKSSKPNTLDHCQTVMTIVLYEKIIWFDNLKWFDVILWHKTVAWWRPHFWHTLLVQSFASRNSRVDKLWRSMENLARFSDFQTNFKRFPVFFLLIFREWPQKYDFTGINFFIWKIIVTWRKPPQELPLVAFRQGRTKRNEVARTSRRNAKHSN